MDTAGLIESAGLLSFAVAVLADLRLLRKAYEAQAEKVAVIEARQSEIVGQRIGGYPRPITER